MARATATGCGPFYGPCYAAPTASLGAVGARATVLARDWDRGARGPTAAFRRQRRTVVFSSVQAANRCPDRTRAVDARIPFAVEERSAASNDVWRRCQFESSMSII